MRDGKFRGKEKSVVLCFFSSTVILKEDRREIKVTEEGEASSFGISAL